MGNVFKRKEGRLRLGIRKGIFNHEGSEALAQVAQTGGRRPLPGNI